MFGGVAELDAADELSGALRFEGFVERADRVRVEVVAHEDHLRAVGVTALEQAGHFDRPIDLGAPLADGHFAPPGERFSEQENARGPGAFVLVVDTLGVRLGRGNRLPRFLQQLHRLIE